MAIKLLRVDESHLSSPLATTRRATVLLCAVAALLASLLAFQGAEVALGQADEGCEIIELGSLGGGEGDALTASGRWAGEDCESRFFTKSDAHNYSFSLLEGGQVRVELMSEDGDSFRHLLRATAAASLTTTTQARVSTHASSVNCLPETI